MSEIMSYAVGKGDMFYINHCSDNFTIIDCYLKNDDERQEEILKEIKEKSSKKGINRFISTHPDEDHIKGLTEIQNKIGISNFYCVKNKATKKDDETKDFKKYCELRDSDKAFFIKKGIQRKWMNQSDDERGSSGISVLWPDTENENYKEVLKAASEGGNTNNLSPVIKYSLNNGIKVIWFGDLESDFLEKVASEIDFPKVDIVFAPHHGRKSGKLSSDILDKLDPRIIVIGEAPSKDTHYYNNRVQNHKDIAQDYAEGIEYYSEKAYNTITQNSAGDILFNALDKETDIYVSKENYSKDLDNVSIKKSAKSFEGLTYFCTIVHN